MDFFSGESEMGALMRSMDWSQTPLGPTSDWPASLRTAVSICLNSRFPILIWWGPQMIKLYNDAYRPMLGLHKHPFAMGRPGREVWPEIWDIIGPMLQSVLEQGAATWSEDQLLMLDRNGYLEESYFTFSYSPIRDETGSVAGVFTAVTETTGRVIGERRMRTLRDLAAEAGASTSVEGVCQAALQVLARNPLDIPFSMLYLVDERGETARLAGATGLDGVMESIPAQIDLHLAGGSEPSPLWQAARSGEALSMENPQAQFGALLPSPEAHHTALVMPIPRPSQEIPYGLLVAGASSHRPLDDDYRSFFSLVCGQIAAAISTTQALEEERKRAEALAELDRAKTQFFGNVSHEFRTPLTLILGPLQDALAQSEDDPLSLPRQALEMAHRNVLRLLKLVNTLLDFSRLEAGRIEASYEPTDLAAITADLASVFRSAVERAGLRLVVNCPPLPEPLYVDREMWEKIVINLLSNAFKFTFEGEIRVSLRWTGSGAELEVRDTGIGIAESELPNLFQRFYRVHGAQGRTHEGTGIGLALVNELVKLHGGSVRAESALHSGSAFVVSIPAGSAHLPPERLRAARKLVSTGVDSAYYAQEALRWLPEPAQSAAAGEPEGVLAGDLTPEKKPRPPAVAAAPARLLVADDNADMREYLQRLLSPRWAVELVSDGAAALQSIRQRLPDLLIADVMMPGLDGFELLRQIRLDPATRDLPVLMLSARAGEEARLQGLEAGADDYLVKPFSARELAARVEARLQLAALRRESQRELGAILDHLTDAFWAVAPDWTLTFANRQAGRLVARSPEELIGMQFWRVFPGGLGAAESELRRAMQAGEPVTFDAYHPSSAKWLIFRTYPHEGGLAIYAADITARRKAEDAVQRYAQELTASNRDLENFAFIASHDLQEPLRKIQAFGNLLQSHYQYELDERGLDYVFRMQDAAYRMKRMIDDLLTYSRLSTRSQPFASVDLNRVAKDVLADLGLDGSEGSARVDVEPLPVIEADGEQMRVLLHNLLSNAIKFQQPGSTPQVKVGAQPVSPGEVEIFVQDNGIGFDEQHLESLFKPFQRLVGRSKYEGSGIGLAVCRKIVERHNGGLTARSRPGQGSTFVVRLPVRQPRSRAAARVGVFPN